MINIAERQTGLAQQAFVRGLIDETLRDKIVATKASHDMIEVLFSLVCGEVQDLYTAVKFIARMCQYTK